MEPPTTPAEPPVTNPVQDPSPSAKALDAFERARTAEGDNQIVALKPAEPPPDKPTTPEPPTTAPSEPPKPGAPKFPLAVEPPKQPDETDRLVAAFRALSEESNNLRKREADLGVSEATVQALREAREGNPDKLLSALGWDHGRMSQYLVDSASGRAPAPPPAPPEDPRVNDLAARLEAAEKALAARQEQEQANTVNGQVRAFTDQVEAYFGTNPESAPYLLAGYGPEEAATLVTNTLASAYNSGGSLDVMQAIGALEAECKKRAEAYAKFGGPGSQSNPASASASTSAQQGTKAPPTVTTKPATSLSTEQVTSSSQPDAIPDYMDTEALLERAVKLIRFTDD